MQLSSNQWSVILECISFVLVTLDLWGETNLQTLHNKFKAGIQQMNKADLQTRFYKSERMVRSSYIISLIIGLIIVGVFMIVTEPLIFNKDYNINMTIAGFIMLATSLYMVLYFKLSTHQVFTTIVGIIESILAVITSILLYFIQRVKLKGLLLIIGTLFFVFSKVIAFMS